VAAGRKKKADDALVIALACGASVEAAAQKTGVSVRTVHRRLAEPGFRAQVAALRDETLRRASDACTVANLQAIKTLVTLQGSAVSGRSDSARLGPSSIWAIGYVRVLI